MADLQADTLWGEQGYFATGNVPLRQENQVDNVSAPQIQAGRRALRETRPPTASSPGYRIFLFLVPMLITAAIPVLKWIESWNQQQCSQGPRFAILGDRPTLHDRQPYNTYSSCISIAPSIGYHNLTNANFWADIEALSNQTRDGMDKLEEFLLRPFSLTLMTGNSTAVSEVLDTAINHSRNLACILRAWQGNVAQFNQSLYEAELFVNEMSRVKNEQDFPTLEGVQTRPRRENFDRNLKLLRALVLEDYERASTILGTVDYVEQHIFYSLSSSTSTQTMSEASKAYIRALGNIPTVKFDATTRDLIDYIKNLPNSFSQCLLLWKQTSSPATACPSSSPEIPCEDSSGLQIIVSGTSCP